MNRKMLYIDTETTGLDAEENALTQVAAIVVVDGEERERVVLDINPYSYPYDVVVDAKALEITNKTEKEVREYPDQKEQCHKFTEFITRHIDPQDRKDAFQFTGYNTSFDMAFIKKWLKINSLYFSTYFTYKDIDVFALVKHLRLWGMLDGCKNDKLGTVCEYFNIELDAHDAMNDIVATRELYRHIGEEYISNTIVDLV